MKNNDQFIVIRIHKRKAWVALKILMVILLLNVLWLQTAWADSPGHLLTGSGQTQPDVLVVTVQRGDTLWDLAKTHGTPGKDPRKTVYEIQAHNDISTLIVPGQEIEIII